MVIRLSETKQWVIYCGLRASSTTMVEWRPFGLCWIVLIWSNWSMIGEHYYSFYLHESRNACSVVTASCTEKTSAETAVEYLFLISIKF